MAFELTRPVSYAKRERKFFKKYPELVKQYVKTLMLLSLNPQHPSLRLYPMVNKTCHSVSINIQYRLWLTLRMVDDGKLILIDVGDHDIYSH
jgi:plasmid maintenance system killer protein